MNTTRDLMLRDLKSCQENENAIALKLKNGSMLVTGVIEIIGDIIVLRGSLYGDQIENDTVLIDEIQSTQCYNTAFDNPLYKKIREMRKTIKDIKDRLK